LHRLALPRPRRLREQGRRRYRHDWPRHDRPRQHHRRAPGWGACLPRSHRSGDPGRHRGAAISKEFPAETRVVGHW